VHKEVSEGSIRIAGREPELAAMREWFVGEAAALVLCGGVGMGKTTLWEAGIASARERGLRVLVARPSGAEARHSFAALIDLCDGVDIGALVGVPAPQRAALEVALLRADPGGVAPAPQAIALGVLNGLRVLSGREPLLVAIDDLQWLDPPSADALEFVAGRLGSERVRFLFARRPGGRSRPRAVASGVTAGNRSGPSEVALDDPADLAQAATNGVKGLTELHKARRVVQTAVGPVCRGRRTCRIARDVRPNPSVHHARERII
jgi:hypothetical protein